MKYSIVVTAAAVAGLALCTSALAQVRMPQPAPDDDPNMRMPVPGGGAPNIRGTWSSGKNLFGQYRVWFTIGRGGDGSYQVKGGGLNCTGDTDWSQYGTQVNIRMGRGACNRNTDWSRDRITCYIGGGWGEAPSAPTYQPAQVKMPVPNGGGGGGAGYYDVWSMNCVYYPSTGPYGPQRFTARRTN